MANGTQKVTTSAVVRIWTKAKEKAVKMQEAKTLKEDRPVSEAEIVSKAVDLLYEKEAKKLGI